MTAARVVPNAMFTHLKRLTDARGLFEHAEFGVPRVEHGYCVDDVARGLVTLCREPVLTPDLMPLLRVYLRFTLDALDSDGACRNRMDVNGAWQDEPGLGDWWGRALWGLGVAAVHAPTEGMRARALLGFRVAAAARSPHPHAMAYATLGAAEVRARDPDDIAARELLEDSLATLAPVPGPGSRWDWPRDRMTYANGTLVESLLALGEALPDARAGQDGLRLLEFLLGGETRDGHLSVTPVRGRGPGEAGPAFDQQPIEVAALAEACARAFRLTGSPQWRDGVRLAWAWFRGDNDTGIPMFDPSSGAGFDGLLVDGRNLNQGAESSLAALSTYQHALRLGVLG